MHAPRVISSVEQLILHDVRDLPVGGGAVMTRVKIGQHLPAINPRKLSTKRHEEKPFRASEADGSGGLRLRRPYQVADNPRFTGCSGERLFSLPE